MKKMAMLLIITLVFGAASSATLQAVSAIGQGQVVVVVVGAPGTPEYATHFAEWAGAWEQVCSKSNVTFLAVGVVLIGHGTFDGRTAKFNLRGPDISADELAGWFKPIQSPIAVINTASSSAPFLKALSAPGELHPVRPVPGRGDHSARSGSGQRRTDLSAGSLPDGLTSGW